MRRARLPLLTALALLIPLVPQTLAVAGAAPAAAKVPTVLNPGFELGTSGWEFSSGAGIASNHPHGGAKAAYLDGGSGFRVGQTLTAPTAGRYDISAWIATGGPNGRFVVRVNGVEAGAVTVPKRFEYSRHTVSRVAVARGDRLEIAFESGDGWLNVDDVMISPAAPADPRISSSDPAIVEMFDWAKRKANSWVLLAGSTGPLNVDENNRSGTGTATYGPSYWAGYANRSGYYSRDMAHQVVGAQVLGLTAENRSMLHSFAASATEAHKYYPVWAQNFDTGTYLSIDYRNPDLFVREVPAPFELVEKAAQAYRWSGDPAYVDDQVFWDFYRHTTKEFVALHNAAKGNGAVQVAEGTGRGIFSGTASYNEQGDEKLAEAGDGIAAQYQAYLAVASLAEAKGDTALAAQAEQQAAALKQYFNSEWSGTGSGADMVRAYSRDGTAFKGWGLENSWFMPMKQIIEAGPRNEAYLDFIDHQASGGHGPSNIEAFTYLPDTFFANNRNDTAWKWMQYVYDQRDVQHVNASQGPNGDYPEVSFTLVGQTVSGLLGLAPDAPNRRLTTQSRLPAGMDWLQVDDIPVGKDTVSLRQDGATGSTLTNHSTARSYTWEARFVGSHPTLTVNGVAKPALTKVEHGVTYSYLDLKVTPGQTVRVGVAG
ncbi:MULTISPECIES: hypothetical protein [unclassified Kitasatospora]|uniref:hypothetical protein n=1 Tax=unclassified Kitasatospora TaxID=2633591 RepID=UPI000710F87A|nr:MULTISPECIES: hypothetical protein [unclassified Kitasatospora]KQV24175.1 hypothetical protein ASC99_03005 [Kitasatospora sp. Root107]KRB67111.1 hypothetical protein ASE03_01735 [Kitasatospora sp. Root187]